MAQQLDDFGKSPGLSGMLLGYFVQALTENLPFTAWIAAPPACHAHPQFYGSPLHREVLQMPQVAAVTGCGQDSTVRASSLRRAGRCTDHPGVIILVDAARHQRRSIRQQVFLIQCIPHNLKLSTLSSGTITRVHQK
jgi:hypothetical protein